MDRTLGDSDVAEVFAKNLQTLIAHRPSISEVSRDLDINRTQFNRYLSGEAHPRPEVLAKICAYFNCDARILLTPLDKIRRDDIGGWPFAPAPNPFEIYRYGFDHSRMPDGLYEMLTLNMFAPDAMMVEIVRLFTTGDGVKGINWSVPMTYAESIGVSTGWRDRKQTGRVQQHVEGVSFLKANPYSRMLMMVFLTYGFRGMPTVYPGYAALTQSDKPFQNQVQPYMLRKLPKDCAGILRARRMHRDFRLEMLPDAQRDYFENWHAP